MSLSFVTFCLYKQCILASDILFIYFCIMFIKIWNLKVLILDWIPGSAHTHLRKKCYGFRKYYVELCNYVTMAHFFGGCNLLILIKAIKYKPLDAHRNCIILLCNHSACRIIHPFRNVNEHIIRKSHKLNHHQKLK